jgi:hypothetical protein
MDITTLNVKLLLKIYKKNNALRYANSINQKLI